MQYEDKESRIKQHLPKKGELLSEPAHPINVIWQLKNYQCPKDNIYCIHGWNRDHTSRHQNVRQGGMYVNGYLK